MNVHILQVTLLDTNVDHFFKILYQEKWLGYIFIKYKFNNTLYEHSVRKSRKSTFYNLSEKHRIILEPSQFYMHSWKMSSWIQANIQSGEGFKGFDLDYACPIFHHKLLQKHHTIPKHICTQLFFNFYKPWNCILNPIFI